MRTQLTHVKANIIRPLFAAIIALTATFSFSQEQKEELRFGVRIALGKYVSLGGYEEFVGGYCSNTCRIIVERGLGDWSSFGQFYEIGAMAAIPIINTITFNPGFSVIYRKYNEKYYLHEVHREIDSYGMEKWRKDYWDRSENFYDIAEWAISIPVLFQGMPFGGPLFYLEGGFLLELPFVIHDIGYELKLNLMDRSVDVDRYKSSSERNQRTKMDLGLVLGFGWNINEHFALDSRNFVNLVDRDNFFFVQFGLGLNYLF